MFDFNTLQDASENYFVPEPVGDPLRLEVKVFYHLEHVTEVIVWGEGLPMVSADKPGVIGKMVFKG